MRCCWLSEALLSSLTRGHSLSTSRSGLQQVGAVFSRPHRWAHIHSRPAASYAPLVQQWQRRKDALPSADTIYALSTAPGRAAIAVIRISGPACLDIYGGLCPGRPFPHPRTATLRQLYDPRDDPLEKIRVLDNGALVIYFPAPKTVTGDDVLELHVHGGPALVRSVLEAIPACTNSRPRRRTGEYSLIRYAEPGEFTKRAFYNGRLDLTQAEALGDMLAAETEQQRKLAVSGTNSGLATRYEEWRRMLLYARGELEALIDFSEDQHFDESPVQFLSSVSDQVTLLKNQIKVHNTNASKGELLRNGISIAILGAPNAGKSSLLNRIVGREAAIVSTEEGTTRDIVDVSIDIGGWLCRLGDMAGLRSASSNAPSSARPSFIGAVEQEGIRRARERALQSDVVTVLLSVEETTSGSCTLSINEEVVIAVAECCSAGKTILVAINKMDLIQGQDDAAALTSQFLQIVLSTFPLVSRDRIFWLSCKTSDDSAFPDPGQIQAFLKGLTRTFIQMTSAVTGDIKDAETGLASTSPSSAQSLSQSYWAASLSVSHRQRTYLQRCLLHLDDFTTQSQPVRIPPLSIGREPQARPTSSIEISSHHVDDHADLVAEIPNKSLHPIHPEKDGGIDIVTAAEHLRFAADCLANITGRGGGGDVEDVLGVVFEK